jgi:hypothetical protein
MSELERFTGNTSDSAAPMTDAELAEFVAAADRKQFVDDSILEGEGVSPALIVDCKKVAKRLTGYPNILDYQTFPRDREGPTYRFFEGEHLDSQYSTGRNPINNPMQLLRPRTLTSSAKMVYHGISSYASTPKNYAATAAERDYLDTEYEQLYATLIADYERLFITVLESTNAPPSDRAQTVSAELARIFEPSPYESYIPRSTSDLPTETPEGWLVHSSLAVTLHPSDAITPAARIRALELLKLYPNERLRRGFCGGSVGNSPSYFNSGLRSSGIKERLPYTLLRKHDRHVEEHKDWEQHPAIAPIVAAVKDGDYRSATTEIISRPLEAVQLSVLMLHVYGHEDFGLHLLSTLPDLDKKTQALMFGPQATFYTDNKITNSLEDQVAEGAGIRIDPTLDADGITAEQLRSMPTEDLRRQLARAFLRIRSLEEMVADLAMRHEESPHDEGRRDPSGYCEVLGLDPNILDFYDADKLEIIIKGAARTMSKVEQQDLNEETEATWDRRQQAINVARDMLLNPEFRRTYGL